MDNLRRISLATLIAAGAFGIRACGENQRGGQQMPDRNPIVDGYIPSTTESVLAQALLGGVCNTADMLGNVYPVFLTTDEVIQRQANESNETIFYSRSLMTYLGTDGKIHKVALDNNGEISYDLVIDTGGKCANPNLGH